MLPLSNFREFCVTLPMPPSLNHAYSTNRLGRRFPTSELVKFKAEVAAILSAYTQEAHLLPRPNEVVYVRYSFFYPPGTLINHGWPKRAKNLHKKLDLDNRVKLLQDAIFEAIGVDDSQVYEMVARKNEKSSDHGPTSWVEVVLLSYPHPLQEEHGRLERNRASTSMRESKSSCTPTHRG